MNQWLWLVWVGLAITAGVVEVFTLDLIFLMVAGGALTAAVAAAATGNLPLSILVFAAATVLLMLAARPPLLRYMGRSVPSTHTNVSALPGRSAVVLTPVSAAGGTVKLAGEVWTARADTDGVPIEVGATVTVLRIEGATAVVAVEQALPPAP